MLVQHDYQTGVSLQYQRSASVISVQFHCSTTAVPLQCWRSPSVVPVQSQWSSRVVPPQCHSSTTVVAAGYQCSSGVPVQFAPGLATLQGHPPGRPPPDAQSRRPPDLLPVGTPSSARAVGIHRHLISHPRAGTGRQRLGRGHESGSEEPWQTLALDRTWWRSMEASFAWRVTHKTGRAAIMFADVQQQGDAPRN